MVKQKKSFELRFNLTLNKRSHAEGLAFLNGKVTVNMPDIKNKTHFVKVINHEVLHVLIDLTTDNTISEKKHHFIIDLLLEEETW